MTQDDLAPEDGALRVPIGDAARCAYIAEMCEELRALAIGPTLRDLNYLLDLARAEAEHMARVLRERRA